MSATPAPWAQYEYDPLVIVNQDGSSIGDMKPGDPYIREAEALANARIVATAPELLAVVSRIAKRDPVFAKGAEKQEIADARELVAKATGQRS